MQAQDRITLDYPISRGDSQIDCLELRRPGAGELRGLNLTDILQMDVSSLHRLLPRISSPALTEAEVSKLDPADLLQCASMVASFLLTRQTKAGIPSPVV